MFRTSLKLPRLIFALPHGGFLAISRGESEFSAIEILRNRMTRSSSCHVDNMTQHQNTVARLLNEYSIIRQRPDSILEQVRWLDLLANEHLLHKDTENANKYTQQALNFCHTMLASLNPAEKSNMIHTKSALGDILTTLATIQQQNDPNEAISTYKKVIVLQKELSGLEFHHNDWNYYVKLALSYLVINEHLKAIEIYKLQNKIESFLQTKILVTKNKLEEQLTNQGVITALYGDITEARDLFHKALEQLPKTPCVGSGILHYNLHYSYQVLGDKKAAANHYQDSVHIFSEVIDLKNHSLIQFLQPAEDTVISDNRREEPYRSNKSI